MPAADYADQFAKPMASNPQPGSMPEAFDELEKTLDVTRGLTDRLQHRLVPVSIHMDDQNSPGLDEAIRSSSPIVDRLRNYSAALRGLNHQLSTLDERLDL